MESNANLKFHTRPAAGHHNEGSQHDNKITKRIPEFILFFFNFWFYRSHGRFIYWDQKQQHYSVETVPKSSVSLCTSPLTCQPSAPETISPQTRSCANATALEPTTAAERRPIPSDVKRRNIMRTLLLCY